LAQQKVFSPPVTTVRLSGRPDAVAIAARYVVPDRFETMGERLRTLNEEVLYLVSDPEEDMGIGNTVP
jgi:hypothetical protein